MQTKLDDLTREVFDLQETINWKDKKIGVGGPTWVLRQNMRSKRWLCFSAFRHSVHPALLPLMLSLHDGDP